MLRRHIFGEHCLREHSAKILSVGLTFWSRRYFADKNSGNVVSGNIQPRARVSLWLRFKDTSETTFPACRDPELENMYTWRRRRPWLNIASSIHRSSRTLINYQGRPWSFDYSFMKDLDRSIAHHAYTSSRRLAGYVKQSVHSSNMIVMDNIRQPIIAAS